MNSKLKLIERAFIALEPLNNHDWTNHREAIFALCLEEEKGHRRGDFAQHHTPDTINANQAARLFVVKRIAEYLEGCRMPRGKDYLHMQKSCFYAAGLVEKFRKEIRKAWNGLDMAALSSMDYCEFVRVAA